MAAWSMVFESLQLFFCFYVNRFGVIFKPSESIYGNFEPNDRNVFPNDRKVLPNDSNFRALSGSHGPPSSGRRLQAAGRQAASEIGLLIRPAAGQPGQRRSPAGLGLRVATELRRARLPGRCRSGCPATAGGIQ